MPMKVCKDCGTEVSKSTKSCPKLYKVESLSERG